MKEIHKKLRTHEKPEIFALFHPRVSKERLGGLAKHYDLTNREAELLGNLLRGLSVIEAAGAAGLQPHTMRGYAKDLHKKIGVEDRHVLFLKMHAKVAELTHARFLEELPGSHPAND